MVETHPSQVKTFKVVGRLVKGVADSEDESQDPDLIPIIDASVIFTPTLTPPIFKVPTATTPVTIFQESVVATTDSEGYLKIAADSELGVVLPWGGSPEITPTGWTWSVTISVGGNFPETTFFISGGDGSVVDLSTVIPVSPNPGAELEQWIAVRDISVAASESAEAFASEAKIAKEAAELVPAQVDDAMASHVGSGGEFDSKLKNTFATLPSPDVQVHCWVGQSNPDGRALPFGGALDPADSRLLAWDWATSKLIEATVPLPSRAPSGAAGLSMATIVARQTLEREHARVVVIVNACVGGSSLAADGASGVWRVGYTGANPALYAPAIAGFQSAIAAVANAYGVTPTVRGFFHQGEADSNAVNYQTYLDALIGQWRTDLSLPDMTVTLGGIVPEYILTQPTRAGIRAVHIDTPARVLRTAYADGIPNGGGSASVTDIVHYHRAGAIALGEAMYEASLRAATNTTTSVPMPPLDVYAEYDGETVTVTWTAPLCRVTEYLVEVNIDGAGWEVVPHATLETSASYDIVGSEAQARVSTANGGTVSAPTTPVTAVVTKSAVEIIPSAPGFSTTFTQADGPVRRTDDGKSWRASSPSGTPLPLVVVDGKAGRGSGGTASRTAWRVDAGTADGHLQAKIGNLGDSSAVLIFRALDVENYLYLTCRVDSTTRDYRLLKRVSGTISTIASAGTVTSAAGDEIDISLMGDQVTVTINGVSRFGGAKTVPDLIDCTLHGVLLQAGSSGAETWDSISFVPA